MSLPTRSAPKRPFRFGRQRSTVLTVALIAVAAYFLIPLLWLVISSTKSNADLFSTFGFSFGRSFDFVDNVISVFTYGDGIFGRWLGNTALYAIGSALGAAILTTAAGYAFAMYRFPGDRIMYGSLLAAVMVPTTALAIPTYLLFATVGLTNTPFAVILPSLVSPFAVYLMRVFAAEAIPPTLIEAARIDGAGELRIFWQIAIRLLTPGIVTVFLFTLVATWNNYFLPLIMLSDDSLYPVTLGLAQWQAISEGGGGVSEALYANVITGSLLSVIPLIVAFLYLQKYWVSGLAAGSVKE
jgi:multiple sugar transport system permease protein